VREDLPNTLKAETALHEILHSIRFMYGLDNVVDEESVVQIMGQVLTQVFRDNKDFWDWYRGLLDD